MKKYYYPKTKHCKCGKLICDASKQCRECADKVHSKRMTGESNSFFGKHHTTKTKYKIGKENKGRKKSKEFLEIMSEKMSGKGNAFFGKKHTEKTKKKISKKHVDVSGNKNPMFGKPCPHSRKIKYKGSWMRSSYEVAYARYCLKNHIKYRYEYKRFYLKNYSYLPDFYLLEKNLWIEIKGWWRGNAKKIFRRFKRKHPKVKITVLMKPDLQKLDIIK